MDDKTPTLEEQSLNTSQLQHRICHATNSSSSSSRSSSTTGSASTSASSDSSSSYEHHLRAINTGAIAKRKKAPSESAQSDLSNSYHEIFDTQMPPSAAAAALHLDEEDNFDDVAENLKALELPNELLMEDSSKEYLTSKLLYDSQQWKLKQQSENPESLITPTSMDSSPTRDPSEPPIVLDPNLIQYIENDARNLATSVDSLIESLSGVLHSISALTVESMEIYRDGVCKTCDEVDNNIKSMYQLMAKVEELNKSMGPAYEMGAQLKMIKQLLDVYESSGNVGSKSK